mgnify:CR=1 FL=1
MGVAVGGRHTNTMLASAAAGVACTITVWLRNGKPDLAMVGNGVLAGLVGITASASAVTPQISILIGVLAGILVVVAVWTASRGLPALA